MTNNIFAVDVETTGTESCHQILTIGVVDEQMNKWHWDMVHDNYIVAPGALRVNGINLATHTGLTSKELAAAFHIVVPPGSTLLGRNPHFDYGFLKRWLGDHLPFTHRLIDTFTLLHTFSLPCDLGYAETKMALPDLDKHHALFDAYQAMWVYKYIRSHKLLKCEVTKGTPIEMKWEGRGELDVKMPKETA